MTGKLAAYSSATSAKVKKSHKASSLEMKLDIVERQNRHEGANAITSCWPSSVSLLDH